MQAVLTPKPKLLFKNYANLHLLAEPFVNRCTREYIPKSINFNKILVDLFYQQFSSLGRGGDFTPEFVTFTEPGRIEPIWTEKFLPEGIFPRSFPVSLDLFADYLFKITRPTIISYLQDISEAPISEDRLKLSFHENVQSNLEKARFVLKNSLKGFLPDPLLIEHGSARLKLLDSGEKVFRDWEKSSWQLRRTSQLLELVSPTGFGCGGLSVGSEAKRGSTSIRLWYGRFLAKNLEDLFIGIQDSFESFSGNRLGQSAELVLLSSSSFTESAHLLEGIRKALPLLDEEKLRIPELCFGWNPISSLLSLLRYKTTGVRMGVFVEKLPIINLFLAANEKKS